RGSGPAKSRCVHSACRRCAPASMQAVGRALAATLSGHEEPPQRSEESGAPAGSVTRGSLGPLPLSRLSPYGLVCSWPGLTTGGVDAPAIILIAVGCPTDTKSHTCSLAPGWTCGPAEHFIL